MQEPTLGKTKKRVWKPKTQKTKEQRLERKRQQTKGQNITIQKEERQEMASLMNVESFFAALTGGEELEIDFPSDRLFRKLGVYLRLLFAAILIGASFTTPNVCYKPGTVGQMIQE